MPALNPFSVENAITRLSQDKSLFFFVLESALLLFEILLKKVINHLSGAETGSINKRYLDWCTGPAYINCNFGVVYVKVE